MSRVAMACRSRGEIQAALRYEEICELEAKLASDPLKVLISYSHDSGDRCRGKLGAQFCVTLILSKGGIKLR